MTYEGKPCRACGGVERYRSRGCVACQRRRSAERYATPEGRAQKQSVMRAYYERNAERECERARQNYDALDTVAYNRKLLKGRRQKALVRMADRNARGTHG